MPYEGGISVPLEKNFSGMEFFTLVLLSIFNGLGI